MLSLTARSQTTVGDDKAAELALPATLAPLPPLFCEAFKREVLRRAQLLLAESELSAWARARLRP